jgi:CcmD family protein
MTARFEKPRPKITTMMKRLLTLIEALLLAAPLFAFQAPTGQTPAGQAPAGQSEYVAVDELPPVEQLPAAPLLIAAYAFVWLAVFFYVWTIWRRLNHVQAEIRVFEKRHAHRGEGAPAVNRTQPR